MFITRSKELTVSMGDYESFKFGATARLTHHDLGLTDDDLAQLTDENREAIRTRLTDLVNDAVDAEIEADLKEAISLSRNRKSFVHSLAASDTPAKTPARTGRN